MFEIKGYDNWKTREPEEIAPSLVCAKCGQAIFIGESYYEVFDEVYCEDCMVEAFRKRG